MLKDHIGELTAPDGISYSIVTQPDRSCFIRAASGTQTFIIGLFANEAIARAWIGVLDAVNQVGI
jgi:hypothetical protein